MTAIDPDNYMCIVMSYQVPLMHGLIDQMTIRELKSQPTYDAESFAREYESKWSGAMKGAAFSYEIMQKVRKIQRAEYKAMKTEKGEFYVLAVDMAKDGSAKTAAVVLKVRPREFNYLYQVVNAFPIDSTDYSTVANELKKAATTYEVSMLVYDATGVGASIRDWLNKDTVDISGELLPGLGIINPPENAKKDIIKRSPKSTICFEVKSSGVLASEINYIFFSRLKSGAVKMLVTTNDIINKLKDTKSFALSSNEKQKKMLRPYQFTDIMQEELLNLDVAEISENGSTVLRVKRRNTSIQKDFFSALSYGIYAVHKENELGYYKRKDGRNRKAFFLMSKTTG